MYRKGKGEQDQKMQTIQGLWSFRQLSLYKNVNTRETGKSNIKLNNIKRKIITTGTNRYKLFIYFSSCRLVVPNPQQRGAGQSLSAGQSGVRFLMGPKPAMSVDAVV